MATSIGGKSIGSHFGTMSMKDGADAALFEQRVQEGIRGWQELSQYAYEQVCGQW